MLLLSRILITFVSLTTLIGSNIADWNSTHIFSELWPPHDSIACGRLVHSNDRVGRADRVRGVPAHLLRAGRLPDRIRQQPLGHLLDLALRTAVTERCASSSSSRAFSPGDIRLAFLSLGGGRGRVAAG